MYRRLETIEQRTEQLTDALAEGHQIDKLREDALKERLTGLDKSVREVGRGVQAIKDKQVSLSLHQDWLVQSDLFRCRL